MNDDVTGVPSFPDVDAIMKETIRLKAERDNRLAGRYDAQDIFDHLMERAETFQKGLSEVEEIGAKLANFGEAAQIHVRSISFQNPNLIEFHGVNSDGHEVTLIQHISQLNFLLIAVKPIKDEPYRIGFGR